LPCPLRYRHNRRTPSQSSLPRRDACRCGRRESRASALGSRTVRYRAARGRRLDAAQIGETGTDGLGWNIGRHVPIDRWRRTDMKFGAMVATKIDDWQIFKFVEELGYDHGWVPDSQMIWSDCYATLALVAANTSRMRIGPGVAIAPTRLAPVTAHSIASIARLAPGRVFLGIGTGHTAMRVMGMRPMVPREFREYLRVVRELLAGEEVEYTHGAETRAIRFLNLDRKFIELEQPIPIWVAANGPGALRAAGAYGDGRISALHEPPEMTRRSLAAIAQGAAHV